MQFLTCKRDRSFTKKDKEEQLQDFEGYHSEWNLGSPGGWDYQRLTQIIGQSIWSKINELSPIGLDLDFNHPLFYPVNAFVDMLAGVHRSREGHNPGMIAVVAEEETLADVTENKNLARHISAIDGLEGNLMAPQELELQHGRVCYHGQPVSIIFMDFNTDVLLDLHRKHNLDPVIQAVAEHRVINPRGTEPINVKSMFEVITGQFQNRFHAETVRRTPWTRQFYARQTLGPKGESITDLIEWTRLNWDNLVLKPERGYSGKGVRVGQVNSDPDEAIALALQQGNYIVQAKVPLPLWSEEIPVLVDDQVAIETIQTDFRCLMGPSGIFGFLGRYGGVPTNVGSGGGVQPLAVLKSAMDVKTAVAQINEAISHIKFSDLKAVVAMQDAMALAENFTYLLGPIKIALRPRIITASQIDALARYGRQVWADCLIMEKMWLDGELDHMVQIEEAELEIARMQPWGGSPAIIASDGLFGFGAGTDTA